LLNQRIIIVLHGRTSHILCYIFKKSNIRYIQNILIIYGYISYNLLKIQVVELFNKFNESLGSYTFSRWIGRFIEEYQTSKTIFLIAVILLLILLATSIFVLRKWKNKEFLPEVKEFVGVGTGKPRFRKRDKVLFYGRKMLRKVKSIGGQVHATGQGKKRRAVMRFARRLLQLKKETAPPQLKVYFIIKNNVK